MKNYLIQPLTVNLRLFNCYIGTYLIYMHVYLQTKTAAATKSNNYLMQIFLILGYTCAQLYFYIKSLDLLTLSNIVSLQFLD